MISKLAWVSAREARGLDDDEAIALKVLRESGVHVDVIEWDEPSADWAAYDRVAIRSTWDYVDRIAEFGPWIDRVAAQTELVNPPAMLRWSMDKRYLAELEASGIPITSTDFVAPGEQPVFPSGKFVVKPAIGAGSREAASYSNDQHEFAAAHVARLHAAGIVVLVQPFVNSVATDGEWPMLFFNGEYSHCASKRVNLPHAELVEDFFAAEDNTFHTASADQIAVAQAAVDFVAEKFGTPMYARVDLVRGDGGEYRVMEVELVEPSLFLPFADAVALEKFARAFIG